MTGLLRDSVLEIIAFARSPREWWRSLRDLTCAVCQAPVKISQCEQHRATHSPQEWRDALLYPQERP